MAFLGWSDRSLRRNIGVGAIGGGDGSLIFLWGEVPWQYYGLLSDWLCAAPVTLLESWASGNSSRGNGYDGQMFLSLGLDPGLRHEGTIAALDLPLYRYRRILYPLLGYLLGLGNPALIPYSMVAINLSHRLPNPISMGINSNFGLPLIGVIHKLGAILLKGVEKNNLFEAACFGGLLWAMVLLLGRSRGDRLNRPVFVAGCLYAVLLLLGNDAILSYFMGYSRVYMDMFFLLMLMEEDKGQGLKIWPFILSALPTVMFVLLAR
jgi:hypothetical protein